MKTSITKNKSDKKIYKALAAVGSFIFWVGVWQLASFLINDSFFLPAPFEVLKELVSRLGNSDFLVSVALSMLRVIAGYAAGVAIGVVLAALTSASALMRALFAPLLSVIRATPVVSIIILAFLLLSRTAVPSFIVILMVAPIIWANITEGIKNTDRSLIEMSEAYGFSFFKKLRYLYIPSAMPYFASSAITAFGFAWKSGVAAEIICYPDDSIGKLIYRSRTALDNTSVFALTAAVVIISILFELALKYLIAKLSDTRMMKIRKENSK